jgi:hypothetical protein
MERESMVATLLSCKTLFQAGYQEELGEHTKKMCLKQYGLDPRE